MVLFVAQDDNGNLITYWAPITEETIKTSREIFYEGCARIRQLDPSFKAKYYRTPVTDEQSPSPEAMEDFIRHLENDNIPSENRVLIFNCQMGRCVV